MSRVEPKDKLLVKIECVECKKLFNSKTVLSYQQLPPGPGDSAYIFKCDQCSEDEKSMFQHTPKTWLEVAITVLYNLERIHKRGRFFFQNEITAFIEENWSLLNQGAETNSWTSALCSLLATATDTFEINEDDDEKSYALLSSVYDRSSSDNKKSEKQYDPTPKKKTKKSASLDKSSDRNGYLWCHQCKQKHANVLYCSRTCSKKYCTRCVKRHYREEEDEIDLSQWVCYYCQGVCTCAFCRRKRAKETNTKFESHRGKKRRSADSDSAPTKKRKLKSQDSSTDNTKDSHRQSRDDSWIVEDDIIESPEHTPRRKNLRNRNSEQTQSQSNLQQVEQLRNSKSTNRRRRVTLKDLIDSQILLVGDELNFKNAEKPATLLQNGQILWSDMTFKSLSTFAKSAAHKVGTKSALYNGWRVVYCRGKVMDCYRKQYRKYKAKKPDEIEESSNDLSDNLYDEENFLDNVEEEEDFEDDHENNNKDIIEIDDQNRLKMEEEEFEDEAEDVHIVHRYIEPPVHEASANVPRNMDQDQIDQSWWTSEEDEYDTSPCSYSGDDLLIFGHLDSSSTSADEQDLLVMDYYVDNYLDIRDKDFFNIASGDDTSVISRPIIEDSFVSYFAESVEDFYSGGIDSEYL